MAEALQAPALTEAGFAHAFFTRRGGVSAPPYATLNFSATTGDSPEAVAENIVRAARVVSVAPERVYFLSQVHGTDARVLTGSEDRQALAHEEGDVTLSREPGVGCGVRMADCPAVLIADRASGAVAAAHSGWRGTVKGVVPAAVEALRSLIGGEGDLIAAIGPHIEQCCFEVGEDVAAQIAGASSAHDVIEARDPRPHADLRAVISAQLADLGVATEQVAGCTMCDVERFHSYRRDGAISGRMLALITPRS